MDISKINQLLISGDIESSGVLPHLENLKLAPFQFEIDFGLKNLLLEHGLLLIRNAVIP